MANECILVVDDEEDILELLRYNLQRDGFQVITAANGEDALTVTQTRKTDLIVLDLMLPGIDGLGVMRRLKQDESTRSIPIVMLTARGEESDIVTGLELGADDYVTKPFSPRVLTARIRAVLRRGREEDAGSESDVRRGDLLILPERRQVLAKGESVGLTYTEFQVLSFLARRPGWVFTRSQIVDAVRGGDYPVTDRSVDVQIVGLRKKLKGCGHYIETVRGVGYRFKENP